MQVDFENIVADEIEKNSLKVNIPQLDSNQIDNFKSKNNNLNDRKIKTNYYESLGSAINETNIISDKFQIYK